METIEWERTNSNILYIATNQNTLKVYDLNIKKIVQELVLNKQYPHTKLIHSTFNNKVVVVQLREIDRSSQIILFEFSKNLNKLESILFEFFQITTCVDHIKDQLILACSDGVVRVLDLNSQEIILTQRCHNQPIVNIKISLDKKLLVTATCDQIYIWTIEDQFELDFMSKIDYVSNEQNYLSLDSNQSILFLLDQCGCSLISLKRLSTLVTCEYQMEKSVVLNLQNSSQMSILVIGNQDGLIRIFKLLDKF